MGWRGRLVVSGTDLGECLDKSKVDIMEPGADMESIDELDADLQAREGLSQGAGVAAEAKGAARADTPYEEVAWVGVKFWFALFCDLVDVGGGLSRERFMGTDVIEFLTPLVEHTLLGLTVGGGPRLHVGGHVRVHTLVSAIVLGTRGT